MNNNNNILETRELGEFDAEAQRLLSYFELPGAKLNIGGSSQYKNLHYRSDYDLMVALKRSLPPSNFYESISQILHKMEREPNIYFLELKLESKEGEKRRLHPRQEIRMSWVERDYDKLAFAKIDTAMRIKNRFYEASCVYLFRDKPLDKKDLIEDLMEDTREYEREGNYYKVLKRQFSIAVLEDNQSRIHELTGIFNSPLGQSYERLCNMKALALLHESYKDKATTRKINENIRLLNETFRITIIEKHIRRYQRELNKEAKKLYLETKKA